MLRGFGVLVAFALLSLTAHYASAQEPVGKWKLEDGRTLTIKKDSNNSGKFIGEIGKEGQPDELITDLKRQSGDTLSGTYKGIDGATVTFGGADPNTCIFPPCDGSHEIKMQKIE